MKMSQHSVYENLKNNKHAVELCELSGINSLKNHFLETTYFTNIC